MTHLQTSSLHTLRKGLRSLTTAISTFLWELLYACPVTVHRSSVMATASNAFLVRIVFHVLTRALHWSIRTREALFLFTSHMTGKMWYIVMHGMRGHEMVHLLFPPHFYGCDVTERQERERRRRRMCHLCGRPCFSLPGRFRPIPGR